MILGSTAIMCYKCGGTQDIPCADKNRHYLTSFIYAKNKFGVSCMTEDRRESSSLQMCFKLPATENRLEEKGCLTDQTAHKDYVLCDTDLCNGVNVYHSSIGITVITTLAAITISLTLLLTF